MKRQRSTQGGSLPKQHCPTRQFASRTQALVTPVNQINQYFYNGPQACSDSSGQSAQKSYYYNNDNSYNSNYNYANSTNNSAVSQENLTNGWIKPMQYNPSQFTLANPTPAQFFPQSRAPADFTSAPFTSAQFTPVKPTYSNTSPNTTPGVNFSGSDLPLSYRTHVPDIVSERGFLMQNQRDSGVLCNPPQKANQPNISMTAVSVNANMTQNEPNGQNNITGASFHISTIGTYETQVPKPKPPKKRRQPTKRREPEDNSDFVDLVAMITRTPKSSTPESSTPRLRTPKPPAPKPPTPKPTTPRPTFIGPVNHPMKYFKYFKLPEAKEPQGDIVKPCEDTRGAGFEALEEHLELLRQQEADARRAQEKKEREEAEKRAEDLNWPGDPSEYPAECFANIRLPGCRFRAHAICIGSPRPGLPRNQYNVPPKGRLVVYAVRRGSNGVEFKLVEPHSTPEEVTRASEIQFNNIILNANFSGMDLSSVIRWSRYLLDAVPGRNDSVTMWSES